MSALFLDARSPPMGSPYPPITVRRARGERAFLDFEPSWRSLFEASPSATPFQSFEWLSAWRRCGEGEPVLLAACVGETPIAAMALMKTRHRGSPLQCLKWMGAPESDYQDFVGGMRREECAAAFVEDLLLSRDWHFCELGALRPDLTALLSTALGGPQIHLDQCMALPLPADRETFERDLGRRRRKAFRQHMKALETDQGPCVFSTIDAPDALPAAMADLFRLHGERRGMIGDGGAFVKESVRAFHREVAAAFLGRGWLRLHRLTVAERCIATLYCFHLRDATYFYQSGFDPAFARYSPGALLIHHAIGAAIDDGAREFDFMRGVESYKTRWRAEPRANGHIVFGRSGVVSRAAVAIRRLERAMGRRLQSRHAGGADDAADDEPAQSSNTPSSA
jgi:CelD/BcsL family acetyltransferase involved in cellulose biosynthesis